MKIFDIINFAVKKLKGKWPVITAFGVAAGVFCLCFAGAIFVNIQEEKALPYELTVAPQGTSKLSESAVVQIEQIQGVADVTTVVQIPVKIKTGMYTANITLTGLKGDYVNRAFKAGGIFPKSTGMPYIVLNEAALKLFSDGRNGFGEQQKEPDINWLTTSFVIQAGEDGQSVTAKVSGILLNASEEEEPLAVINLKNAQELLRLSGQPADPVLVNVRVDNIGCSENVANEITKIGFAVNNTNEAQQSEWDNALREANYLIVLAIFSLVFTSLLMQLQGNNSILEDQELWTMLRWIGMKKRDILYLFMMRAVLISFCGIALGIITALTVPSFLLPEDLAVSCFALLVPWWIAALSAGIFMTGSILSMLKIKFQTF